MRTNWINKEFDMVDSFEVTDKPYVYELIWINMILKGYDTNE